MSISDAFTIQRYLPGDEQGINDLYNTVFGTDRSLEAWRWKYDHGPHGAQKLIYVLKSGGQAVGQYANLLLDVQYRGAGHLVAQPVDVAIYRDYRGKQLIVPLFQVFPAACRAMDISFGFGFPNEAHYGPGRELLGYRDVGEVLLMRRYLNPGLILGKLTRSPRILDWTRALGNRLVGALYGRRWALSMEAWSIERVPSFDERFDRFWERMSNVYPIMVARHRSYLNWRYVERPDVQYTTYAITREGELQGYVVLSLQRRIAMQGLVADLLAVDETATEVLLQRALAHFLDQGVDMASCWALPHTGLYRTLRRLGFAQRRVAAPLVCMVFDPDTIDEAFLCDPRNWYVTMGDSDGV
jgi:hypothetical protein